MKEIWVLEWSKEQNYFHVDRAEWMCTENFNYFLQDRKLNDYHVIFVGTREEVDKMADKHRSMLFERDNVS
jgi:hypothetical protein